jgi:hypothetical protein
LHAFIVKFQSTGTRVIYKNVKRNSQEERRTKGKGEKLTAEKIQLNGKEGRERAIRVKRGW